MAGKHRPTGRTEKECICGCGEKFMARKNQIYKDKHHKSKMWEGSNPRQKIRVGSEFIFTFLKRSYKVRVIEEIKDKGITL